MGLSRQTRPGHGWSAIFRTAAQVGDEHESFPLRSRACSATRGTAMPVLLPSSLPLRATAVLGGLVVSLVCAAPPESAGLRQGP
jgi:hypothetical protein